jgi:hypothetical protein
MNQFEKNVSSDKTNVREKYLSIIDSEGYLRLGDINRSDFEGRQVKNISSLLDGEEGISPEYNLGEGIRYKGNSGNYSDMKIHIDDLSEFIERVKIHYK